MGAAVSSNPDLRASRWNTLRPWGPAVATRVLYLTFPHQPELRKAQCPTSSTNKENRSLLDDLLKLQAIQLIARWA